MNAAWLPSGGGGVKNVVDATPLRPKNVQPPVGSTGLYVKADVVGTSNEGLRTVLAEATPTSAVAQSDTITKRDSLFKVFLPLLRSGRSSPLPSLR